MKHLEFFLAHVHVFLKIIIFSSKVFKLQLDSSITLNVSSKNPILAEKLKKNSKQFQILPWNFFMCDLVKQKLHLYVFKSILLKHQLKLMFTKKCVFWSWKGSNI